LLYNGYKYAVNENNKTIKIDLNNIVLANKIKYSMPFKKKISIAYSITGVIL